MEEEMEHKASHVGDLEGIRRSQAVKRPQMLDILLCKLDLGLVDVEEAFSAEQLNYTSVAQIEGRA